jgi:Spy/CpxP family protein refolding chaperone
MAALQPLPKLTLRVLDALFLKELNMKSRKLRLAALLAAISLSIPVLAATAYDNPPGPAGGPGTNWTDCPARAGGPGTGPDRPMRRLSDDQRAKLKAMTPQQRQAFFKERCEKRMQQRFDRDDNPPGPKGGPGTNWENPPGPQGGPSAGPDRMPRYPRP